MHAVPLAVSGDTPCSEVVRAMGESGASSALITSPRGEATGILTEQDVTHRITFKTPPETPVREVMTAPVHAIRSDDYLYRAISIMRRLGIRHMPVVRRDGSVIGLLDLHEALAVTSLQLIEQIDRLTVDSTREGLRDAKRAQIALVSELFEEAVPAAEIQQLLTDINKDIYRRVVQASLAQMEAEGYGKAPVPFDVLIMGSGGRGENYLRPDQDNGFILDNYPDEEHTRIDGFFIELAERMTKALAGVGFPLCRGNVMATNPLWRKTISQWLLQTTMWSKKRNFIAARLVGIFYDFRWTAGPRSLTRTLRDHVTEALGKSAGFRQELYRDEADHGTALGWFHRLIIEKGDDGDPKGINLKFNGLLPLVEGVRLLAMRAGIAETATLGRIDALNEAGELDRDDRVYLDSAFSHLTTLLLSQQVESFLSGRKFSNYVRPDSLAKRDRELLIESFRTIERLRERLRSEYTADVF